MQPALTTHDRVAVSTRLAYGFGSISEGVKNTAFNTFLLFYYNVVLGLSGTLSGAAILFALVVDAITDPLVGSLSDNWHSRWGRRHPFLYASALPMGVSFWLLFNPPARLGEAGLFVWFATFAVLVRSSMTLYSIPSNAMVAELTQDYDERTSLVSWRYFFGWAGGITIAQVGYRIFFASKPGFEDGRLDAAAYGSFALVCAIAIVVAILVCSIGKHRLIAGLEPAADRAPFTLARLLREMREVFGNRSYLMLVFGSLFASVAGGFNDVVGLYMGTYFWGFRSEQLATMGLFLVIGMIILGVLLSSMIADVADESELVTGKRQEGMFSSVIAFSSKATSGIGGFLAGVALDVIAFPTNAAPGTVPDTKLFLLGLAVGPCMFVLFLLSLAFLRRYRITRARHAEILGELERRGGAFRATRTGNSVTNTTLSK